MKRVAFFFAGFSAILLGIVSQLFSTYFFVFMREIFYFLRYNRRSVQYDAGYIMIIYSIILIFFIGYLYNHFLGGSLKVTDFTKGHTWGIIGCCVMLIPATQFLAGMIQVFYNMLAPEVVRNYEHIINDSGLNDNSILPMQLYAIIFAPLAEEFLFRGFALRMFKKSVPFWIANLFQALAFGIYHMNLVQGTYAFALGIILGYICEGCGSIYFSMIYHILFNIWGTLISTTLINSSVNKGVIGFFYIIALLISPLFIWLLNKCISSRRLSLSLQQELEYHNMK